MKGFRTRFAPSPTYYLHLGHAASALHVWRAADAAKGEVFLRIEDIDITRCRPEYTQAIYQDLDWLGLDWSKPVRVQSDHFEEYADCVMRLSQRGLAYRCFRSRSDLGQLPNPLQPGPHPLEVETRLLEQGKPYAWRLRLNQARAQIGPAWDDLTYTEHTSDGLQTRRTRPELHGDIVLARKDSPSAYHLAATFDDALQGMTDIVRGEDLIDAPHIQTVLQVLMGWPQPIYHHHALLYDADGKKLSKRQKSITLASLRDDGITADQIKARLGFV